MNYKKAGWCSLLVTAIFMTCSAPNDTDDEADGGGYPIPNPNSLTGVAMCKSGIELNNGNISVILFRNDFNSTGILSKAVDSTVTDSTGKYGFDLPVTGNYSIIFVKEQYKGFSGYFEYTETQVTLDTICLSPAITITGVMRDVEESIALLSLIGVGDSVLVETENMFIPEDKYFEFKNSPAGNFVTRIVLDYGGPGEKMFAIPLSVRDVFSRDTTYTDTSFGLENSITIINEMYSLTNKYCRMTCYIE